MECVSKYVTFAIPMYIFLTSISHAHQELIDDVRNIERLLFEKYLIITNYIFFMQTNMEAKNFDC